MTGEEEFEIFPFSLQKLILEKFKDKEIFIGVKVKNYE